MGDTIRSLWHSAKRIVYRVAVGFSMLAAAASAFAGGRQEKACTDENGCRPRWNMFGEGVRKGDGSDVAECKRRVDWYRANGGNGNAAFKGAGDGTDPYTRCEQKYGPR